MAIVDPITVAEPPEQADEQPLACRWEAECTCPDFCERDHELD